MGERRFIFFDVGNTLLFPNRQKMLAPVPARRHPTLEQWQALERRTKKEFDQSAQSGRVDHGFWWMFHNHLLDALDFDEHAGDSKKEKDFDVTQSLLAELVANTQ